MADVDSILDEIDEAVEGLSRSKAKDLIEQLRDELNLRATDFDGYYGEEK